MLRARLPAILTLVTISLVLANAAQAKTIYSSGDWSLDDSQPGAAGKGNCVAATATYLGNHGAYSLNLVLDKSGARPLEVMIRPFKSPSKAVSFRVTIDSGRTYTFVKLPRTAKGEDTFWQLPRGTGQFIAQLKASNQLNVDASNGMGELPFSMSGATAVLNKLEKLCLASPSLNSAAFEKAFLPNEVNTVDPGKIDQPHAGLLRDIVAKAVGAFHHIEKMNAELAALEARYKKLNEEKATLTADLSQLSGRELPSLTAARDNAQLAVDKAALDITNLKASIARQQELLTSAKAAYDTAVTAIKPFVPEHDRLLGIKGRDESRLSDAETSLAGVEQSLAGKGRELDERTGELAQLRGEIIRVTDEARRARVRLAEAESALRSFDPHFEVRARKNGNRRLDGIESDIRTQSQNVRNWQQQVATAEADRASREQALKACESRTAGVIERLVSRALASNEDGQRGPRGGFGGRDGGRDGDRGPRGPGGHNPGQPNPPPAPPAPPTTTPPAPPAPNAPDCTAQRNELAQADQRLITARQSLSQAQVSLQGKISEKESVERQIEIEVYRDRDEIVRREGDARRWVANLEGRRDQIEIRTRDLNQYVIPNLQSEIANLGAQRSSGQSELSAAQQSLARSTQAYRAYKSSVNYDALDADVDRTAARVSAIQQEISGLQGSVRNREQITSDQTTLRESLNKKIAATKETIAQKTGRLGQVNESLVPYGADRKVADDRIEAAKKALADISREYAGQLPQAKK